MAKSKPQSGRVPLCLQGAEGVVYAGWPVTQGVPFAEGALPAGTPTRVVSGEGRLLPTQAGALATWRPDGEFVRWLLLDFQADAPATSPLFLEYGPDAVPPPHPSPVRIEQWEDPPYRKTVSVDTGRLRMEIDTQPPQAAERGRCGVFVRCSVEGETGWDDVWTERQGPVLYMSDQHGIRYDSATAAPQPCISAEESGPLRGCVCIRGHHASTQGHIFCPYVLRLHFSAGSTDVRIQHTFVFDQEPEQVELAEVGLRLPTMAGPVLSQAVAGEKEAVAIDSGEMLEYLQSGDAAYEVRQGGRVVAAGRRSRGWVLKTSTGGSALAVFKDLWQEYPGGMAVEGDEIDMRIWPAATGRTLAFTTPFKEEAIFFRDLADEDEEGFRELLAARPNAPLNLKSYLKGRSTGRSLRENFLWVERMVEKYGEGHAVSLCDTGTANGAGAAKTTEIYCRFSTTPIDTATAERVAACVQEPLIAPAEPAHTCASKALGQLQHAGDQRLRDVDAGLDWVLDAVVVEPRRKARLYGKMTYGNLVCSHSPGPSLAWREYKDSDPARSLRWTDASYNNESNDQILAVWSNFARTGRRDQCLLAQTYSRCVADVAFMHARPDHLRDWVGLMHYHNAHRWSGIASPSHSLVAGILVDYYFTGNRRLLDVAREAADHVVRSQEPAGIVSCRDKPLHREYTGPLWSLMELYEVTWEEQYGVLARRSLHWLLQALGEPPNYPVSVYTRGARGDEAVVEPYQPPTGHWRELYCLYATALRLFPSKQLRERIIADADYCLWHGMVDNYITGTHARELLSPGSRLWQVDDTFYWTEGRQWRCHDSCGVVCLAYDLTGDPLYAAYARHRVMRDWPSELHQMRCGCGGEFFSSIKFGNTVPRLARVAIEAEDRDREALAEAEREWKQRRADLGHDVYDGPGIDDDIPDFFSSHEPVEIPLEGPVRAHEPKRSLGRLPTEPCPI